MSSSSLKPTQMFGDNEASIKIVKSGKRKNSTKHMDIRFKALEERYRSSEVKLDHVRSEDNHADLLTKHPETIQFMRNIGKIVANSN